MNKSGIQNQSKSDKNYKEEDQRAILYPPQKKIPPIALLSLGHESWYALKKALSSQPIKEKRFSLCEILETPYFSCIGPVISSPVAVMVLEQMIASGVKNIIALGCAGSLQSHLLVGDCLLATGAISEEGTSSHYLPGEKKPMANPESLDFLRKILTKENIPFQEGMVWTTDAPYRELVWKVKQYQQASICAVEMEISALYTVAQFYSIFLSALVVISDEIFTYQWKRGFHSPAFKQKLSDLSNAIVKELSRF